jgi:enamine deaminase RidA (YjgF/YER057c/UK114 family)
MNICKKQMTKKYMRLFRHVDVWHGYLGARSPTSATLESRRLSHPDLIVEIEALVS